MERRNDLHDHHGDVVLSPLGEHAIGASLTDTLPVAVGCGAERRPTPRYRGAAPSALYARMLRRYLAPEPDGVGG